MADPTTEQIDALLSELDFIARDYEMYEYGLPMHGADEEDGPINKLRAAVRTWLSPIDTSPGPVDSGGGDRHTDGGETPDGAQQ